MNERVLFLGRNGFNVATVTEDENGQLAFSYTIIPDRGYLAICPIRPHNQDLIEVCKKAKGFGFKVEIPEPNYGTDFDFTEKEFIEQMLALEPHLEGTTVYLDTIQVFKRRKPNGDPYCLIRMDDGTIMQALKADDLGLTTYSPSDKDMAPFGVPEDLIQRFRNQKKYKRGGEWRVLPLECNRIRELLQELGVQFEE